MMLSAAQVYDLLDRHTIFALEACDKCSRVLGAVRFTRRGEAGEWCSSECRGDAARLVVRKGGRPKRYRNLEERRAAKTRQQRGYRSVAVWKKPSCSAVETNHLQT
jgi:hypothetical protein